VLFAKDSDKEQGLLKDVFLKSEQGGESQLVYAQSARLPSITLGSKPIAEFFDGYMYILDHRGNRDITSRFDTMVIHLPIREAETRYQRKAEPTFKLRQSSAMKDIAEYQARISSPLATILLAMLAVPLGRTNSRQTRFGSFFIAVLVYALSLSFVGVVRNWLENGDISPNPGMWLAYIVPALLLILLLNSHNLHRLTRS
jgi:lipopolysaccharide export system permease protein